MRKTGPQSTSALHCQRTRNPAEGVIAIYQVIVASPECLGTQDCFVWVALKTGVVAYLKKQWVGTADEAEASLLVHLTQGYDTFDEIVVEHDGWMPMVYAPLDPDMLETEISRGFCPDDDPFLEETVAALISKNVVDVENARQWMSDFVEMLDEAAIKLWRNINKNNKNVTLHAAAYNLIVTEDPTATKYRQQAFQIYPWLATYLYPELPMSWPIRQRYDRNLSVGGRHQARILDCIDQGKKLIPFPAELLDIPQAPLRHSKGLFLTALFRMKAENFSPMFRSLANHKGWPFLSREGDIALLGQFYWLNKLGMGDIVPEVVRKLDGKPSSLWKMLFDKVRLTLLDRDIEERINSSTGSLDAAKDFLRALVRDSRHKVDLSERDIRKAVGQWVSVHGLQAFMKACHQWHEHVSQIREANDSGLSWTPLTATPIYIRQRMVIELSDQNALLAEGYAMQHCVGSFAEVCINEGSRIFSIRDLEGNRCSTLELIPATLRNEVESDPYWQPYSVKAAHDKDILFRFGQHYAARNSGPSEMCMYAADHLRVLVNSYEYTSTRIKINNECLEAQENDEDSSPAPDGLALACLESLYPLFERFQTNKQDRSCVQYCIDSHEAEGRFHSFGR